VNYALVTEGCHHATAFLKLELQIFIVQVCQFYLLEITEICKVVPLLFLTENHAIKTYWGSGYIGPRILDLGTSWR